MIVMIVNYMSVKNRKKGAICLIDHLVTNAFCSAICPTKKEIVTYSV